MKSDLNKKLVRTILKHNDDGSYEFNLKDDVKIVFKNYNAFENYVLENEYIECKKVKEE